METLITILRVIQVILLMGVTLCLALAGLCLHVLGNILEYKARKEAKKHEDEEQGGGGNLLQPGD